MSMFISGRRHTLFIKVKKGGALVYMYGNTESALTTEVIKQTTTATYPLVLKCKDTPYPKECIRKFQNRETKPQVFYLNIF